MRANPAIHKSSRYIKKKLDCQQKSTVKDTVGNQGYLDHNTTTLSNLCNTYEGFGNSQVKRIIAMVP